MGGTIDGSTMIGMLVIIYSVSEDSDVYYNFVPHDTKQQGVYAVVTELPGGQYEVSVYVMEESGLPFQRAAATPKSVLINGNLLANYLICSH